MISTRETASEILEDEGEYVDKGSYASLSEGYSYPSER